MNDVHYANEKTGHSPFGYKARENGWLIGNERFSYWESNDCTIGSRFWYQYALDYSVSEVRERFLKEIDDRLSVYDPYGIELDWHRQIWSFKKDDVENCKYINEFMAQVNEIVAKYEKKYGHKIKIAVRINRDIEENRYFGFDVRHWAKNDWLDVIIPATYWGSSDSDMPIEKWVEEMKEYGIEVWAGLECSIMNNARIHTIASLAGYTAQYLGQGADKIYLYNMFGYSKDGYDVCKSLEAAQSAERRSYIVTESNCTPYGVEGIKPWRPIPFVIKAGETNTDIVINHSLLNSEKDTVVYIGANSVSALDARRGGVLSVKYNGVECEYLGISKKSYMKEETSYGFVLTFKVPKEAAEGSTKGALAITANQFVTVSFLELMNGDGDIL
jgi:hypothetical protein